MMVENKKTETNQKEKKKRTEGWKKLLVDKKCHNTKLTRRRRRL
jgi:hypothetical protein